MENILSVFVQNIEEEKRSKKFMFGKTLPMNVSPVVTSRQFLYVVFKLLFGRLQSGDTIILAKRYENISLSADTENSPDCTYLQREKA